MADDILKNIPLPADLPENWTSQQTVAPTGAEVGMDEQYGYNYLMRQVNNAQKALKALAAQREEDLARIKFWASNDPTSPASFIGGTWERIEGKFIMGASDTYPAGSTGGEAAVALSESNNGPHSHYVTPYGNPSWNIVISTQLGVSQTLEHTARLESVSNEDAATVAGIMATKESGSGVPHNNIPPYYSMYIWRRVA